MDAVKASSLPDLLNVITLCQQYLEGNITYCFPFLFFLSSTPFFGHQAGGSGPSGGTATTRVCSAALAAAARTRRLSQVAARATSPSRGRAGLTRCQVRGDVTGTSCVFPDDGWAKSSPPEV